MITRGPASAALALFLTVWPGCAPTAPGRASDADEVPPAVQTVAILDAAEVAEEPEPTPATLDEIRAICRVFRLATYGRWDDQRTRGELGGLEMTSDVAAGWQARLSTLGPTDALDATRAVLDAAHEAGVASACEPLEGLVAVTSGLAAAPVEAAPTAEAGAGPP